MITTSEVIAQIESSGRIDAMRFEPSMFKRISTVAYDKAVYNIIHSIFRYNFCDLSTSEVIYCTSWGMFQLMGFNIYGRMQYTKSIIEFCSDPNIQEKFFNTFLMDNNINFTPTDLMNDPEKLREFARIYNGDTTGAYAAKILSTINEMEKTTS